MKVNFPFFTQCSMPDNWVPYLTGNFDCFLGSPSGEIVAKKSKIDPEASEVETILSGQVLDTHIPGLEEYMSHEIFGPLMRLSPPPCERDYFFNLDDNEGVCELFDVV